MILLFKFVVGKCLSKMISDVFPFLSGVYVFGL